MTQPPDTTAPQHRTVVACIGFGTHEPAQEQDPSLSSRTWTDLDRVALVPLSDSAVHTFRLVARTPSDLRRAAVIDHLLPHAERVDIEVAHLPSWRVVPLPSPADEDLWRSTQSEVPVASADLWRSVVEVTASRRRAGWRVVCAFEHAVSAGLVVASMSRGLDGHRVHGIGHLAGPTGPGATLTYLYDPAALTPADVFDRKDLLSDPGVRDLGHGHRPLSREPGRQADGVRPRAVAVETPLARTFPGIDERSVNPVGFLRHHHDSVGVLRQHDHHLRVTGSAGESVHLPASGAVTDVDVERLRPLRALHITRPGTYVDEAGLARTVAHLAAGGIPLYAEPDERWDRLVGPELRRLITDVTPGDLSDPLTREQHSIRTRRHALRQFGIRSQWRSLAGPERLPAIGIPRISVVLCTRRPDMVSFGLENVARQRGVEVEVILALHGITKKDLPQNAWEEFSGDLTLIEIPGTVAFGEALNRAAFRSRYAFVAKMDDDDWYGPEHLADLTLSHLYTGAELVGSSTEFVYLQEEDVTVERIMKWEAERLSSLTAQGTIGGGTMLVSRNLFESIGGFRLVPAFEDGELCSAVRAAGGTVYRQHGLNHLYRRRSPQNHLWQTPNERFLAGPNRIRPGVYLNDLMTS